MSESLWGEAFDIKPTQNELKKAIKKTARAKKTTTSKPKTIQQILKSKVVPIKDKLLLIKNEVLRVLGVYKENTVCIRSRTELHRYIDVAIANDVIAIDTETNNSLDPLTCLLMGACIYTPGEKNAYIPINHTDLDNNLLPNQLSESDIKEEFDRLKETKIIMHNGKFDYEVIKCTCDCDLDIYWDTMVGSKILNNTEKAGLKEQYISKIDSSVEKYSITSLFDNIPYAYVDPEIFAYYAATDAFMTYQLYQYQVAEYAKPENSRLYYIFKEVEMPIVKISADMELTGIELDIEYCNRLKTKYDRLYKNIENDIAKELNKLKSKVDTWRNTDEANVKPITKRVDGVPVYGKSKNEQLADPPEVSSPTQLAILLYDILKVGIIDKNTPRGTGADILKAIDLDICKLLVKYKKIEKLKTAFIDTLPTKLSTADNRLHAHFNQDGTDTGRFSCTSPNLQQIPSKSKDIRLMFKATDGYKLVGADFSAQEPRLFAEYSHDKTMLKAFEENKDIYATLGTKAYKTDYWNCMEHHPDGSPNPEGKKRRKACKILLLGILYGMGVASIAEGISNSTGTKITIQEAQKILDDFYDGFPGAKMWIEKTQADAHRNGYVEDFWGRRRIISDILLPKYEVKLSKLNSNFNPLLGSALKFGLNSNKIKHYEQELTKCRTKNEVSNLKIKAEKDDIYIKDNSGFIAAAERQCVNARVQGGAATMSKKAMINISKDKELQSYGFRMLLCVHDEIIGECREEYADKCAERLSYIMSNCVPELEVQFKCDPTIESNWGESDYWDSIQDDFNSLLQNSDKETAFDKILKEHSEQTIEKLNIKLFS